MTNAANEDTDREKWTQLSADYAKSLLTKNALKMSISPKNTLNKEQN